VIGIAVVNTRPARTAEAEKLIKLGMDGLEHDAKVFRYEIKS